MSGEPVSFALPCEMPTTSAYQPGYADVSQIRRYIGMARHSATCGSTGCPGSMVLWTRFGNVSMAWKGEGRERSVAQVTRKLEGLGYGG